MATEVSIRLADERDLAAIAAFGAAVVPAHYEPIIGRDAALEQVDVWWTYEQLHSAWQTGALLIAEDDELVGVAELGSLEGEPVVWKLYIDPERRGEGTGRRLLHAAIAEIPRPASRVVLEHFAGNERAAAFYEREGFHHLRTEPAASGDPAAATVWRARPLDSL